MGQQQYICSQMKFFPISLSYWPLNLISSY
uniref:Uncharacterized protein n=1 Tax=Rhizophora mucronata TaxID=61149 RepID=A0A2P2NH72_RHIMU